LTLFAYEIHLIHRSAEYTANALIVKDVHNMPNVTFHVPLLVRAFLGTGQLTEIRLESRDGAKRYDVPVDGVFLEIGLRPNSHAVSNVLQLTDRLEVPVNPDQSTAVSGLFAGDVTDVRETQIAIAVGQWAIVTLSAHKYLIEHQLI
jgi:alkyl hydroperoxide reductase subunit F